MNKRIAHKTLLNMFLMLFRWRILNVGTFLMSLDRNQHLLFLLSSCKKKKTANNKISSLSQRVYCPWLSALMSNPGPRPTCAHPPPPFLSPVESTLCKSSQLAGNYCCYKYLYACVRVFVCVAYSDVCAPPWPSPHRAHGPLCP